MACIRCGTDSPNDYDSLKEPSPTQQQWDEWRQRHGPGKCGPICEYCARDIPHARYTCSNPSGPGLLEIGYR